MADEDTSQDTGTDSGAGSDDAQDGQEQTPDYKAEAEKWKALSRKHEQRAKANEAAAKRVEELESSSKTETERLADQAKAAQKRAEDAEQRALRYEVALDKQVPANLMKFLSGESREDMEASADELLEAIKGPATGATDGGSGSGKPKERLKPGASNSEEPTESDPRKLAEAIGKTYGNSQG